MLGEPSKLSGLNWLQGDGLQLCDFATTARRKCSPYTVLSEKLSQEVLLIAQHIHYRPQLLGFSSCLAACPPWMDTFAILLSHCFRYIQHSLESSLNSWSRRTLKTLRLELVLRNRLTTPQLCYYGQEEKTLSWPSIIRNSCRRAFYLLSTSPSGVFTIQPCCDTIHHFS